MSTVAASVSAVASRGDGNFALAELVKVRRIRVSASMHSPMCEYRSSLRRAIILATVLSNSNGTGIAV